MLRRRRVAVVAAVGLVALGLSFGLTLGLGGARRGDELLLWRKGNLYTVDLGNLRVRLVALDAETGAWSPDGARIAFTRSVDLRGDRRRHEIWTMRAEGSGKRRIWSDVDTQRSAGEVVWSPDGKWIAFDAGLGVAVLPVSGGRATQLLLTWASSIGSLSWSSDGREIVVAGSLGSRATAYQLDRSGRRLLGHDVLASGTTPSPDGTRIAYVRSDLGERLMTSSLHVSDPDGSHDRMVTRGFYDSSPVWYADGRSLVFVRRAASASFDGPHRVFLIPVDGGTARPLDLPIQGEPLQFRPSGTLHRMPPPVLSRGGAVVPSLAKRSLRNATAALRRVGLAPARDLQEMFGRPIDGYGRLEVLFQAPTAGARLPRGSLVQLLVTDMSDPFEGRPFDETVWKAHPTCESDNPRGRMVGDIASHVLPVGTPKAEVVRRLGAPPEGGFDYPVGEWSGFRLDCDYLRVELDGADRVSRVYHWQS